MTDKRPESVWVRVLGAQAGVFSAEVLNQPKQLLTVRQGDHVHFVIPASGESLLMVRPNYLAERAAWIIGPCSGCGSSELLDAPSELITRIFPDLQPGDVLEAFTAFCGICGGVHTVQLAANDSSTAPSALASKKWWQFWK